MWSGDFTWAAQLSILLLLFDMTGRVTARPEIKCSNEACLYEEDDQMELTCFIATGPDQSDQSGTTGPDDVIFSIHNEVVNRTRVSGVGRMVVRIALVAVMDFNAKFATCSYDGAVSQKAALHVLKKPKPPKVTSCQRMKTNELEELEELETFQCTWQPIVAANDVHLTHQLYWSRRKTDESESSTEWKACPHLTNGFCTWYSNSSDFFADESGSTDGWKNCVLVVAQNFVVTENLLMKNHSSEVFCFGMQSDVVEGMPAGAVVGITLGVVVTVLLVLGSVLFIRQQKKKMRSLRIEVPESPQIAMEDQFPEETRYYMADNDDANKTVSWQDSCLSNVTTPSTGNSTAPLLNSSNHHHQNHPHHQRQQQHFSFPITQRTNYVKSKLPNGRSKQFGVQTKEQADLIRRLMTNNDEHNNNNNNYEDGDNDDDDLKGAAKDGVTYAVIRSTDAEPGKSSGDQGDDHVTDLQAAEGEKGSVPGEGGKHHHDDDEDLDFAERDDGIYTVEIPWSTSPTPAQERSRTSPGKASMTSYTVIAPSPVGKPRNLAHSGKPPEDV